MSSVIPSNVPTLEALVQGASRRSATHAAARILFTGAAAALGVFVLVLIFGAGILHWGWSAAAGLVAAGVATWRERKRLPSSYQTAQRIDHALEARDLYTRQHSTRVTEIALTLGRELNCSAEELNVLSFAGPLHDIGKIGIRDEILLKPGRLTAEEFEKIKEHPVIGANMLTQLGLWERERQIIRCHHERFDGAGYPDGLARDEIPFLARILSVADAYDAMASDRAYRQRMAEDFILEVIRQEIGRAHV